MSNIIKVTFADGSTKEVENYKPLVHCDDKKQDAINVRNHRLQFVNFDEMILESINQTTVKNYAINEFDLVDEDEIETPDIVTIDDFSDEELVDELSFRNQVSRNTSIISSDFLMRFCKIIDRLNTLEIDNLLTEIETKNNIL